MRFGIQLGIGLGDVARLPDQAQLVEEIGYDVTYLLDHLVYEGPERQRMGEPAFDSMALAISAAPATRRARVQMHGGIGMTDEHDIGFFLKRARSPEIQFGDVAVHRDRVAELDGD